MTGTIATLKPPGHSRNPIARYMHWLHTRWPAGLVEPLPEVREDGSTRVAGLYVVGDLTGVPLLKFAAESGARVVRTIMAGRGFRNRDTTNPAIVDLVIVGGGVAGFSAAMEAERHGLRFTIVESAEPFATIANFPRRKPIFTYPTEMTPDSVLQFHAISDVKEGLLEDLRNQTIESGMPWTQGRAEYVRRAGSILEVVIPGREPLGGHAVIVAIGRSGNHRQLRVQGEELDKVSNRLHDPADFAGQDVLVIGGGDSAVETAVALAESGASVTLSYRGDAFTRPKPENLARLMAHCHAPIPSPDTPPEPDAPRPIRLRLGTVVTRIRPAHVELTHPDGPPETLLNEAVFAMIGREPPLDFFRRSGVPIRGERTPGWWATLTLFLVFCVWMYHWKKSWVTVTGIPGVDRFVDLGRWWADRGWFPYNVPEWWSSLGGAFADPANLLGTLRVTLGEPGFYYSIAYCLCVVLFGIDRIRRRRTPYITVQTITLMLLQCIPLFLLPYVLLPWMGYNGWFDAGLGRAIADGLFPQADYGHGREYWRAFGLILAWPLFIWNVFTEQPMVWWLVISVIQTFVIIPAIIYRFGKGAYCGWICSCGALAETLGDRHRQKMPHGPGVNRLNMIGQVFLAFAIMLLVFRTVGWVLGPDSGASRAYTYLLKDLPGLNYVWFVDLLWAGILGVGLYFHFSGRVWCRFACPLAALMHIYARFSQFRILADKKKCISCNVCTSVCHQGIDVMSFANRGEAMEDPQCVRCSACVQSCPTGVLTFGRVDRATGRVLATDRLAASPVQMVELTIRGNAER